MKIMLTGEAANGITWLDVSAFDISMENIHISPIGYDVVRPVLTLNTCEELLEFQEKLACHIERAKIVRTIIATGEVLEYVCSIGD